MAWDGRKGEPTMLNLPKRIYIKEVGPRDGLQIEKTFVPTATKIEMIDRLSQCGFADIQSAAFVHPKAVPNMADAEEVLAGITRQPGVEYSALVPNLRGFQRAAAAGVKRVELTLSATDSHNINNMNMTTEQSIKMIEQCLNSGLDVDLIVGLAVTFGCPFEGVPPFSRLKFVLDQLSAMGIKAVGLGDTSGVATPLQVYNTTSRLLDAYRISTSSSTRTTPTATPWPTCLPPCRLALRTLIRRSPGWVAAPTRPVRPAISPLRILSIP